MEDCHVLSSTQLRHCEFETRKPQAKLKFCVVLELVGILSHRKLFMWGY